MANPNTVTIFDKKGEAYEMSRPNARDLAEHCGWTFSQPTVIIKAPEDVVVEQSVPAAEPEADAEPEAVTESEPVTESVDETKVTEADFDDLVTREDAVEYLEQNFPDFKPHHKTGRDKLIEKIVEFSNE